MADDDDMKQEYAWESLETKEGAEGPASGKFVKSAGPGKAKYPNGDEFVGAFNEAGQREGGQCTYTWNTAEGANPWVPEGGYPEEGAPTVKYEGGFAEGVKSGLGRISYPNGDRYQGLWAGGKKNGQGTFYYASGDIYSGNWENDQRSGKGTYVFAKDRSQLIGEWSAGQLGVGKWVFEDGTSYHGQFKNCKPIGKGVFYFPNGNQQEGEYVEEGDDEDEDAPKTLVWRGGAVVPSVTTAQSLIRAPLPPVTA